MNSTPTSEDSTPRRPGWWSKLNEHEHRQHYVLLCVLLWSILSFLFVSHFVFGAVEVQGRSMESTLHDGNRHVVNRWVYHFRDPRRGEMIMLNDHIDESLCVKRIVALPGELVELKQGKVYVDGQPLPERYLSAGVRTWPLKFGAQPLRVPRAHYFVLGDNRDDSVDSRMYGPLDREDILGLISP